MAKSNDEFDTFFNEFNNLAKAQAEADELLHRFEEIQCENSPVEPVGAIDAESVRRRYIDEQVRQLNATISAVQNELKAEHSARIASEKSSKKQTSISIMIALASLLATIVIGIISLLR